MKKLILLLLISFNCFAGFSQGKMKYTITVYNDQGGPLSNTAITLIETKTKERISNSTNGNGQVMFELDHGAEWKIQVLKISNLGTIKLRPGGSGSGQLTFTYNYYDWERKHRPYVDRKKLDLQQVDQTKLLTKNYNTKEAVVNIKTRKVDNTPLRKQLISLVCFKLKKSFLAETGLNGVAKFLVPVDSEYEIDIDGIESYNYIDVFKTGDYALDIIYDPMEITEINKRDTISQKYQARDKGATGRALTKLQINCTDCDDLSKENIYLNEVGGSRVYKSKMSKDGAAEFMLPIKKKYLINFLYQENVDVIDLSESQGIAEYSATITYAPLPELKYPEKYLTSPLELLRYDHEKFLKSFAQDNSESPIGMQVKWGNENVNTKSKEALLAIQFYGQKVKAAALKAAPLNVSFVLDKSGSMAYDNNIESLKNAMQTNMSRIKSTDVVSLVAFDHEAYLLMPAKSNFDKQYYTDMINDLKADGGTNIFSGLKMGYNEVLKKYDPKKLNKLILLTDGYDGIPVDSTVNMSKSYNKKGVGIATVGIGNGYNYALLNLLAINGGSTINIAEKSDDLNRIISKEFSKLIYPLGQNVKVTVEFPESLIPNECLGVTFDSKTNTSVSFKTSELYEGLNTVGFIKFSLKNPTKAIEKEMVKVRISYYSHLAQKEVEVLQQTSLKWNDTDVNLDLITDDYIKKLYAIANINHSLKKMEDDYVSGKYQNLYSNLLNLSNAIKTNYMLPGETEIASMLNSINKYATQINLVLKKRK